MPSAPRSMPSSRAFAIVAAACTCSCLALLAGFYLGSKRSGPFPQLQAATAASSDTMAVATGLISEDVEGVFFLDFVTGDLQCLVYYPRWGYFGASYYTNVLPQLGGGGRNSKYMLVTGTSVQNASAGGNVRPGGSLVYVTDVTNGTFAAYAVPWDRTAETGNRPQRGNLIPVGGGSVRNFQLPDPKANQPAGIVDPNKK